MTRSCCGRPVHGVSFGISYRVVANLCLKIVMNRFKMDQSEHSTFFKNAADDQVIIWLITARYSSNLSGITQISMAFIFERDKYDVVCGVGRWRDRRTGNGSNLAFSQIACLDGGENAAFG